MSVSAMLPHHFLSLVEKVSQQMQGPVSWGKQITLHTLQYAFSTS